MLVYQARAKIIVYNTWGNSHRNLQGRHTSGYCISIPKPARLHDRQTRAFRRQLNNMQTTNYRCIRSHSGRHSIALQHVQVPDAVHVCRITKCVQYATVQKHAADNKRAMHCKASSKEAVKDSPGAKFGITIDPAYALGAAYLKTMGFTNNTEIARILDICMNPNSLFIDYGGARSKNASARILDVDKDMRPVVDFLLTKGMSKGEILKIISGHPPVLSYDVDSRLEPFWAYLTELGVQDVNAAVAARPTLLGLDVNQSLRKIVGYLQSVETPPDLIIKYLCETI